MEQKNPLHYTVLFKSEEKLESKENENRTNNQATFSFFCLSSSASIYFASRGLRLIFPCLVTV